MNYIEKVEIEGFWGDKTVNITFNEGENFLIGVNGSGKTTIINLIAATLNADFYLLDRFQFDTISLKLSNIEDRRRKPYIQVTKIDSEKTPYQRIHYKIYKSPSEEPFELFLDDLEEEHFYRFPREEAIHRFRHRNIHNKDLSIQLEEMFNVSWLSIHRFKTHFRRREERSHESLIDQKINEFSNDLLKYLSQLGRKSSSETEKFQKHIFLSLLTGESKEKLFHTLNTIDKEKEKESLNKIYSLFNLEEKEYKTELDEYFISYTKSLEKTKKGNPIDIEDIEYLIGMKRIHSIVQRWKELVNKQDDIYKYINRFLKVVNDLMQRKMILINDKNEIKVETQSGKILALTNLSSGEKQLLIIMGETLLQESSPHIFIADEPELSLHVDWQEKLVSSLKELNPNAQMIFATHSPDIVSRFSDSVIRIENCIE